MDHITEGDNMDFEAVPHKFGGAKVGDRYCKWFANVVWKGERPQGIGEPAKSQLSTASSTKDSRISLSDQSRDEMQNAVDILFVRRIFN